MHPDEFLSLWKENEREMRYHIFRLTNHPDIVDDILQSVFLNCYRRLGRIEPSYAEKYFLRAAGNAARSYLESKWVSKTDHYVPDLLYPSTPHSDYEVRERAEFYESRVLPAMACLPSSAWPLRCTWNSRKGGQPRRQWISRSPPCGTGRGQLSRASGKSCGGTEGSNDLRARRSTASARPLTAGSGQAGSLQRVAFWPSRR